MKKNINSIVGGIVIFTIFVFMNPIKYRRAGNQDKKHIISIRQAAKAKEHDGYKLLPFYYNDIPLNHKHLKI